MINFYPVVVIHLRKLIKLTFLIVCIFPVLAMQLLPFLAVCVLASLEVSACPKHQYYYQVVDIPKPSLQALGDYIIKMSKTVRDQKKETCYDRNGFYLQKSTEGRETFDSPRIEAIFMHQHENDPNAVFKGVAETERALRSHCVMNLLITEHMDIRRFLLQNSTNDDIFEDFLTDEELEGLIGKDKDWKAVNVLDCTHYLYHLAQSYAGDNISISVINDERLDNLPFHKLTNIGGFWKKGCKHTTASE